MSTFAQTNNQPEDDGKPVFSAGKRVDQVIAIDQSYPDLLELLAGSSGETYIQPLLTSEEEFNLVSRIKIPKKFLDKVKYRVFMGLLPELGRAWITVDNVLYIWSLADETDFYEYDDQDQVIARVELVNPKPGVFGDHIKHILVVTTSLQTIFLAVTIGESRTDAISLYATNMSVPIDGQNMALIKGTNNGRIFMLTKEGVVFEFEYHNPNAWFRKSSTLLNRSYPNYFYASFLKKPSKVISFIIDDERNVMYLLQENDQIEVIYLGDPTNNYKSVFIHKTIKETVMQQCRQQSLIMTAEDLAISSLHVISKAESKRIHLMAVTHNGTRLYFSHHKDAFRSFTTFNTQAEPNILELGYVRIPPPELKRPAGQFVPMYSQNYYDCGILFSVLPSTDTSATLRIDSVTNKRTITAPQPSLSNISVMPYSGNRPPYLETDITIQFNEHVLKITENNRQLTGRHYLKELSQQFSDPPRQFIVLSTLSVSFYNKLRPVDILYSILSNTRAAVDTTKVQSFFERYGQREACAMCLSIICASDNLDIVKRVTNVFFEYGGCPTAATVPQVPGNHLGRVIGQTGITYSGKHEGLVLYFSRIISPAWKLKLFADCGNVSNPQLAYTNIQNTLYNTKVDLTRLKSFMDSNSRFHDTASISDPRFQADQNTVSLELAEQRSVHQMYLLLVECIEALSFIGFLIDSNLQLVVNDHLASDIQNKIADLDLSMIMTSIQGRELVQELVIATITKFGRTHLHAGFNIVTRQLERNSSSFFGADNIEFFKGIEYVRCVYDLESDYEKKTALKESLAHFKKAALSISTAKMESICSVYLKFMFHIGIIELSLERARLQDPDNRGQIAFESTDSRDEASMAAFEARLNTYQFIFLALSDLDTLKERNALYNFMPADNIDTYINHVYETAMRSDDKLFHYQLYDRLSNQGCVDRLLAYDTPYLIPYFQTNITNKQTSLGFLWKYYRARGQYMDAAKCLVALAKLPSYTISLDQRLEYLSLAHVNILCSSSTGRSSHPEYIREAEEALDAARLQLRARDILNSTQNEEAHTAASELNLRLYSVQEIRDIYSTRYHVLTGLFQEDAN